MEMSQVFKEHWWHHSISPSFSVWTWPRGRIKLSVCPVCLSRHHQMPTHMVNFNIASYRERCIIAPSTIVSGNGHILVESLSSLNTPCRDLCWGRVLHFQKKEDSCKVFGKRLQANLHGNKYSQPHVQVYVVYWASRSKVLFRRKCLHWHAVHLRIFEQSTFLQLDLLDNFSSCGILYLFKTAHGMLKAMKLSSFQLILLKVLKSLGKVFLNN